MRFSAGSFSALTILIMGMLLPSCSPVDNSSALDRALYGDVSLAGSSSEFIAMRPALFKCQACHGDWLGLKEADFVTLNLVTPGSVSSSKLYYRNQDAQSGPGPKNMPSGGYPTMTSAELITMQTWINSL